MKSRAEKELLRLVMRYLMIVTDENVSFDDIERLNEVMVRTLIDACIDGFISEETYKGYLKLVEWITELSKVNLRWIEDGTN